MTKIFAAYQWAIAHPVEAGALLSALVATLRVLYAGLARVLAPYPRVRASLEALAALAPDVLRATVMLARAVTGLPLPSLAVDARDAEIAQLRARVASLAAAPAPNGAPLVGSP